MKKLLFFQGVLIVALALSCTSDYSFLEEELMEEVNNSPDNSESDSNTNDATDETTDDPSSSDGTTDDSATSDPFAGLVTYEADVKPILNQLCVACHNATLHEDGVDLSSYSLAKAEIDDIIESMQEDEDEDDLMPPSGRVDNSIIETLISWKIDGLIQGQATPDYPDLGSSDGNYTYTADIMAIIDQYCILCHGETSPSGGYDISTYQRTVDQMGIFLARIDRQSGQAGVMPPAGRMDEAIIQMIKDWVDQGMPE